MTLITPARRAHLVEIGRMGGYRTAATIDRAARAEAGQDALRAGFMGGHDCTLCSRVDIPIDLPDQESRADALYRLHMARIGRASR